MYIVTTNHTNLQDGEAFTLEWKFLKWKQAHQYMESMFRAGHTDISIRYVEVAG